MKPYITSIAIFSAFNTVCIGQQIDMDLITKESVKAIKQHNPPNTWGKGTFFNLSFGMGPGDAAKIYGNNVTVLPHPEFGYSVTSNRHIMVTNGSINNTSIRIEADFCDYRLWRIQITKKRDSVTSPETTARETHALFGYLLYNLVEKYGEYNKDLFENRKIIRWNPGNAIIEIDVNNTVLSYYIEKGLESYNKDLELHKIIQKSRDVNQL
jgi:hypothetical protein